MKKRIKRGPPFKHGEPTIVLSIRIPISVYVNIPQKKRDVVKQMIMETFK